MRTERVIEIVSEYLEERMPPDERARFEAHLEECNGCRAYVAQMAGTVRALGALPAESPAPAEHIKEELLRRLRDWKRTPRG